MQYFPKSSSSP